VLPNHLEKNHLYYGDNFDVLQRYLRDESVDLVYLDPPVLNRGPRRARVSRAGVVTRARTRSGLINTISLQRHG
jgi:hypothetical protein